MPVHKWGRIGNAACKLRSMLLLWIRPFPTHSKQSTITHHYTTVVPLYLFRFTAEKTGQDGCRCRCCCCCPANPV